MVKIAIKNFFFSAILVSAEYYPAKLFGEIMASGPNTLDSNLNIRFTDFDQLIQ